MYREIQRIRLACRSSVMHNSVLPQTLCASVRHTPVWTCSWCATCLQ